MATKQVFDHHNANHMYYPVTEAREIFNHNTTCQGNMFRDHRAIEIIAVQLENVCDCCLAVLYPQIKFVYEFDYSSNHGMSQDDGLKASNLGVNYGASKLTLETLCSLKEAFEITTTGQSVSEGETYSHQYILDSLKVLHMLTIEQNFHEHEDHPSHQCELKTTNQIYCHSRVSTCTDISSFG